MDWFYKSVYLFVRFLGKGLAGLHVEGEENIPKGRPAIIAVNHQSYFDPPLTSVMIPREIHFFAKQELFDIPILGWLISRLNAIPVRRGVYDPKALKRVHNVLTSNGAVLMFPEGTRDDGVNFLPPKPGIGMVARRSQADIIPGYAYNTNRFGDAVMRRCRVKLTFGDPILAGDIARYSNDKTGYREIAERVMNDISKLRDKVMAQ